ncbi:hypothetical protein KY284_000635 [Solanum tuberosum]|nr:hypothetical protein KY284_000635 [Solanum tuberosum]
MLAIKSMPNDKSPGIDGIPIEFFVKNWTVVESDVVKVIQEFFHTGEMLKAFSCTAVALIPKVPNPAQVKDYIPIACCTMFYKIITKILTIRMKLVIDHVVSPAQSAFIEGRSIIDNVLISHEILKWYSRKGLSPRCVMKVDLRKAYDSIEWCFLESIMAELGFPYLFIKWVMACITSVSYSLLLFGGLTTPFVGKKGIRQGDPMSPNLFVLAMEYLQREFSQLDDLLLFCKAEVKSIQMLHDAFTRFSKASGLQANT